MTTYTLHTQDTAPDKAKPLLENSKKSFGMIPNLHAVMASSPELLEGYQVLHDLAQKTDFSAPDSLPWLGLGGEPPRPKGGASSHR